MLEKIIEGLIINATMLKIIIKIFHKIKKKSK
jgi:hypothetical protein